MNIFITVEKRLSQKDTCSPPQSVDKGSMENPKTK